LAAISTGFGASEASAQTLPDSHVASLNTESSREVGFKKGSFVAAPVPFQNPTFGTGIALGGGYLFNSDETANASGFGLAGFKTSNGSYGYGLGGKLSTANNRWNITGGFGKADVNYDLYVAGSPLGIRQFGDMFVVNVGYGVTDDFSIGMGAQQFQTTINLSDGLALPTDLLDDSEISLYKVNMFAQYDSRDDTIYPTQGYKIGLTLSQGILDGQNDRNYLKSTFLASTYYGIGDSSVIAAKAAACAVDETAPFYDKCALGGVDGFRGYSSTQHIGTRLVSLQMAYRQKLSDRFGFVAFAGAGKTSGMYSSEFVDKTLTAYGLGARIRLSKSFPVDYSIDVSNNDENEQLLYVYVGQRF
jgi:outer membrane protein assembly factor BamA